MDIASDIACVLLERGAVRVCAEPPFVWTSGIRAPIYCDNRVLISFVEARNKIVEGFKNLIVENGLVFDVVGGTATAAIPWAAFLAAELEKPMVYVRPKPKGHGAGKQVEGTMDKGARVLIVEDLFSTGGSSIRSAEACVREFDAEVVGAVAIFTYEFEKARRGFEEAGISFFTLSCFSALVRELDISDEEKKMILGFSSDPDGWWDKISK